MTTQSQLGELCATVRYLGAGTDELAAALYEQSRALMAAASRVTIAGIGDRLAGQGTAAAFEAAARACGQAATLLTVCGRQARGYAAANCGGTRQVVSATIGRVATTAAGHAQRQADLRQAATERIRFSGFTTAVTGWAYQGLSLFPSQVLSEISTVTYAPAGRLAPGYLGASTFRHGPGSPAMVELYGSPGRDRPADADDADEALVLLDTLIHEVAHVMYANVLSEDGRSAWERLCRDGYASGQPPASRYGSVDPKEDFAEAVVALHQRPDWLRAEAPQRYDFVGRLFERLEAEELDGRVETGA